MKTKVPLIVEPHPETYRGFDFITLVKFNDSQFLTVIENLVRKELITYVLDLCEPVGVSDREVVQVAHEWYLESREDYPVSVEFAKRGIHLQTNSIVRRFPVDYITRVIGPVHLYDMESPSKIRKRKKWS